MPQDENSGNIHRIEARGVETEQITPRPEDSNGGEQTQGTITTDGNNIGRTSARKIAANRRNAAKSTGPKSPQGKRNSSRNGIKHGILSKDVVIARGDGAEDAAEFEALQQQLWEKYDPQDIQDELDVEELTSAYWRKRRALRAEMGSICLDQDTIRAEQSRKRESSAQIDLSFDLGATKEQLLATPEGIYSLLSIVNELEAEIRNNTWSHSTLSQLEHFGIRLTGGLTKEQIIDRLASLKAELTARHRVAVQMDSMHLEAQIAASAIPSTEVTTKIVRYTTAIDRRIEQIRNRLEKSFAQRRARLAEK